MENRLFLFLACLLASLQWTAAFAQLSRSVQVIVAPVESRTLSQQREFLGSLLANESVVISASVSENISRILFNGGDVVAAGSLLVELRHAAEDARVNAAASAVSQAKAAYKRQQSLHAKSLNSDADLDLALANQQAAEAALELAQAELADRMIRAPFGGVLGIREVSPGAYVSAGQKITTLDDLSSFRVEFLLPEDALPGWNAAPNLRVRVPSLNDAEFSAQAMSDAVALSATSRSLRVRAGISSPSTAGLRPCLLAVVQMSGEPRQALSVPEAALIPRDGEQSVFVVVDNTALRRLVTVGARDNGAVEITSGLKPDEQVVIHGAAKLRPNAAVTVLGVYDGTIPLAEMISSAGVQP